MNARATQWLLVFVGFWIIDMFKTNVNVAMSSMAVEDERNYNHVVGCAMKNLTTLHELSGIFSKTSTRGMKFYWSEHEQNLISGSFLWIHWLALLPGGILTHYYGTKIVLGMAIFCISISSIFIPFAAEKGVRILIGVRMFQGFVAGVTWPSVPPLTAKWVPPGERPIFLSSCLGGSAGWPVTYFSSSYIIDTFGWDYLFYMQSIVGVVWCIIWTQLAYDSPTQHPRISAKERTRILDATTKSGVSYAQKLAIPWKSILTSKAVWMDFLACAGSLGTQFILLALTPSYLRSTHGLDFKATGIICSIPHVARYIFASTIGLIGKYQRCIPRWRMRKIVTSICTFGAGTTLLVVGLSSCNLVLSMTALSLAIILVGVVGAGPVSIFIDMGPNFTGVLTGMTGTVGALAGLMSPVGVAHFGPSDPTPLQWQTFFTIIGCICYIGGIAEVFFGTSEVQRWNTARDEQSPDHNDPFTQTTLTPWSKSNKSRSGMISF